jgi:predicted TPR repeat methyltransferase
MNAQSTLQMVNAFANQYDCYIKDCHWTGPELFYSWLKPFLKKGQKLLDIGIGTGLSSILYQPDGIEIYGIDGSEEMIRLTAEKQFTRELKQIDLCSDELWFDGIHFDYAIAHAVFHLVGDIEPIVKNCSESFMDAGYFIFNLRRNDGNTG